MAGIIFFTVLFLLNIVAFLLYGLDKHNACYNKWRYPEILLLGLAILGGAYGAGMGMMLFRHKTRHPSFVITVSISFALWMIVLGIICINI